MAEIGNTSVFSQTDANNNSGTQPSFAEGQTPSSLNDGMRALQGAITREWNWRNPTLTTTGSANAYVLTYSVAPAALYNGQTFAFFTNFANTGSATLNINTIGAKTIKKIVAGVKTALSSGDVASGALLKVAYNTSDDSFVLLNKDGDALSAGSSIAFTGNNTHAGTETFNSTATFNGTTTVAATLDAQQAVKLSGDLTPAQIAADQNDYAPTGHASASSFRLSSDASRNITGLAGGADGRVVILYNVGAQNIVLKHDSASSTAANRFYLPGASGDVVLWGGDNLSVTLQYDATQSRWLMIGQALGTYMAGSADMEAASAEYVTVSPLVQQRHPGHPKFWAKVTVSGGTPTTQVSYNLTSITDTATGQLTLTINVDFSSAHWCCEVTLERVSGGTTNADQRIANVSNGGQAAGTVIAECWSINALADPTAWHVVGLGDQ